MDAYHLGGIEACWSRGTVARASGRRLLALSSPAPRRRNLLASIVVLALVSQTAVERLHGLRACGKGWTGRRSFAGWSLMAVVGQRLGQEGVARIFQMVWARAAGIKK